MKRLMGRGILIMLMGCVLAITVALLVGRVLPPAPELVTTSSPTALRGVTSFTRVDLRTGVSTTRRVQLGSAELGRLYEYPPNTRACKLAFQWKNASDDQLNITIYDLLANDWRTHALDIPASIYDNFQNVHGQWSSDERHLIVPYRSVTYLLDTLTGEYTLLPRLLIERAWSPEGRYVAGSVNTPGGIFIYDTVTDTHRTYDVIPQDPREFPQLVQWSPDERYLAVIGATPSLAGTVVWLIDTQTQTVRQATPVYGGVDDIGTRASIWSPDSTQFVIRANTGDRFDAQWGIHVADVANDDTRRIASSFNEFGFPWRVSWSPDGAWILSVERLDKDDEQTLAAVLRDPATGERADLALLPVQRRSALYRWSPDGRYLLLRDDKGDVQLIDTQSMTIMPLNVTIRQVLGWYNTPNAAGQTLLFRDVQRENKRTVIAVDLHSDGGGVDWQTATYRIPDLRDTDRLGVCYPSDG